MERHYEDLKLFLMRLECVKAFNGKGGPVQNVPQASMAGDMGVRILIPLPASWDANGRDFAEEIMNEVAKWSNQRNLARFGYVRLGDCPLLMIGLREK